ncbi:MAG TPA: SusD/RagB family nutrient-binding outer membrane lipoprotein [Puia sp.]|nr:SusD/RagB family nutrient-binding outer membrane lipoprotein [Puia sp.]
MKKTKYLFSLLMGVLLATSCSKKIADKEANPNNPSSVPPNLILGTILTEMSGTSQDGSTGIGALGGVNSWDNVHDWNQYHCQNYNYYGNNIYSWTNGSTETENGIPNISDGPFNCYLVIKNVLKMDSEVTVRQGPAAALNPYEALGRFIKAYYFYNMTMLMGDVPLTQALQAPSNFTPSYTPQEQVFQYVLSQLDSANSDLATLISAQDNTLSASQDIYYGGNLTQWQKAVNSFKLRVLVELSPKAADANLNVPAQFAAILGNPVKYPIFTSEADDLAFVYNPGGSNTFSTYPFNPSNFGSIAGRFNMAATYVSALTTINDPRVFITCDPAWTLFKNDSANPVQNPAQYQYFVGASTGLSLGTMYANASAGLYSFIGRKRYYSNFTGDPNVLIGYKEMLFNIAEGIERGWATAGTAESWYKNGIIESMKFYGIDVTQTNFTAWFLPPTANAVTQVKPYPFTFSWATYYTQPGVQLSSNQATAIQQIVLQKYIAMFETSGYEPYYNWRRTGVPVFQGGSGVGNNGVVPVRWAYPVTEQVQNTKNWQAALSNQGFTADDLNQKIWLLK